MTPIPRQDTLQNVPKPGKGRLRPRIVQLAPDTFTNREGSNRTTLDTGRTVTVSRSTIVRATAERCFGIVTKQLEETPDWDPTIVWVSPISVKHTRVGSTSRVTFDIGGNVEEAVAMIRSFSPNRSLLWTSTHSTRLLEEWRLDPEQHGTIVNVTVGYDPTGRLFGRLADRVLMRSKVEKSVVEMLQGLKRKAENRSQG